MAWMLKRRSVCLPGQTTSSGMTKCSSFALSPSVHRDFQQTGRPQLTPSAGGGDIYFSCWVHRLAGGALQHSLIHADVCWLNRIYSVQDWNNDIKYWWPAMTHRKNLLSSLPCLHIEYNFPICRENEVYQILYSFSNTRYYSTRWCKLKWSTSEEKMEQQMNIEADLLNILTCSR